MRYRRNSTRTGMCRHSRRSHKGTVLIAALACLLIVTAIVGSMLQNTLRARRQLHTERDRRQTELLLQAGADRVAARLLLESDFRGDVWELPTEAIVGRGAGRVTTQVSRSDDGGPWQVRIIAEYPLGRDFPIQRSQTFKISTSTIQAQE